MLKNVVRNAEVRCSLDDAVSMPATYSICTLQPIGSLHRPFTRDWHKHSAPRHLTETCGDLFNSITNPEGAVDSSFLFPLPFQIFIPIDRFSARTERTSYPYKERGKTSCMESRTHPWNASRACTDAMLP